ncbi:threonine synthase [Carboxylicivirga mesophila]|uniref:Threonine synthase n=1 Tax=Carboxylicivirga mesophila TaxID=1166478 RepID=A0ABS5KCA2_9BACT|nr:threonine synthase [Carboxylicivirga mesophila]MBS2212161.1 threonine synthase [Carboxylicivirga mesophila]
MQYYSTNNPSVKSDLKNAVINGLALDKGLFMPEVIPVLPDDFWKALPDMPLGEIGFETLKHFFCPEIPEDDFRQLTTEAFNFPIPLVPVTDRIGSLELFHGPTLAFKDIGARFLARVMARFTKDTGAEVNVLVATSGDTGSAVANGFLGVEGVNVFVLYPKGLVSDVQEKQFTTLGQNITAIEVDGTFDDCQRLVKTAFMDDELKKSMQLTSANSINLARFLPQMVYYFSAYAQALKQGNKEVMLCVPSGNFGNLTAGLIAYKMGLPVKRFVAATNCNDIVPKYLDTGNYQPAPSIATPANAMDVGDPSNFIRIQELFNRNLSDIKAVVEGVKVDNDTIYSTIRSVFNESGYVLDPHGAIGYHAIKEKLETTDYGIFLATAHPAKFPETVEEMIQQKVEQPERLKAFLDGQKRVESASADYKDLVKILLTYA